MNTNIKTDDYIETLRATSEYPSDVEVEEAKTLKAEIAEKHRRTKKKLDEKLKTQNQEDTKSRLELEKKRLSSTLAEPVVDGSVIEPGKKRERRRKKVKNDADDDADVEEVPKDKEKVKRKSRRRKSQDQPEITEPVEIQETTTQLESQEPVSKPKHIDRAAIAAALREKRKRDKENELMESMKDTGTDDMIYTRDSIDGRISTRFDNEAPASARLSIAPEPNVSWETLKQLDNINDKLSFDFFCKEWPRVPKQEKRKEPIVEGDVEDSERRESQTMDDTAKLIEKNENEPNYNFLKHSSLFLQKCPAKKIPTSEVLAKEEESGLLFLPGVVDMSYFNDRPLRNLEEEGLYVGRRPFINTANERRLASRIQKENKMEWFGEDGRIKILPDPLKEIPFRPLVWNEQFNPMPDCLQTEKLRPIVSSTTFEQIDNGDPNNSFQMIINLHSIEFTHHHLFSYEHVLSQRIKQLFIAYQYVNKQEGLDFFQQRILTLKHAIEHLQEKLNVHKINNNETAISETTVRINSYRQEIKNTRNARNNEECYLRKLQTSIIKTWKEIKKERQQTGMTLTDVSVKIKKQLADTDEDYRIWERDITEQINEEKEYFMKNYNKEMKEYEKQKRLFEKQQELKAAARLRQEEKLKKEENSDAKTFSNNTKDETDYFQEAEDIKILSEPDIFEPIIPTPFNEELLSREIRTGFEQSRRLPGEPHIHPILKVGGISDTNLTREELNRRNLMLKYFYCAELFFNNKRVVVTSNKELNQDFSVKFNEKIPIIISQYPEVIVLKIYEKSGFSSKFLGSTQMDVPLPFKIPENEELETYNFKSDQLLVHKTCAVGSGERGFALESLDGTPSGEIITPLYTSGLIFARTVWAVDEEGELMIPQNYLNSEKIKNQKQNRDPLLALGLTQILDLQRRQEWESIESHLDPNDPRDAKFIRALHTNEELGVDAQMKLSSDYFRLNPYMDEFDFVSKDDIDRSLRFCMIKLRNNNVPEFRSLPIPLYDDKVPMELIKDYENRKGVNKNKVIVTGFEARKLIHQEFIEKIRDEVLAKFQSSLMKKSLVEMVREEEIPTINDIFPKLFNLNRFNRPLQRLPEPRKPISVHNIYEMDVEIVVVIQRATNLPVDIERRTLTPFVQVNFQDINRHTDVLEGTNPAWDVELRLPFKPPTTVTSLDTIKDTLLINVYDQQVINMNTDVNPKFHTLHERYERHWLGCLEIPFNTIYLNSKIEGNFRLKQPAFVQGYDNVEYVDDYPMMSVFITLDPEIHPPQSLKDRFDSVEDRNLIAHVERWQEEMNMKFPKRFRRVTVVNMRCQETLITRYISSLKPPDELLAVEDNIKQKIIARFVSLISFMADAIVFPGISDIWSTCDQFLKMLIGDEDEHAVLLCNYFNYLYQDPNSVYLCLGEAIPEGSTAYVLTKESNGDIWLWNASTGMRFKSTDPTCSMFKIGLLVNERNVWANTQQKVQPWELRFDLSIKADWFPLFKTDINLQTVQADAILYEAPFLKEVQDFQLTLENQLRSNIMDWRMGLATNFLIAPRREMIEILKSLEANCGEMNDFIRDKVRNLMTGYKVFGFPINLPYMEIPDVLSRVEATGIHLTADPRIEFAVAVYIKSYPNTVLSIWIYVASLVRNNK